MKYVLAVVVTAIMAGCSGSERKTETTAENPVPTKIQISSNTLDIIMPDTLSAGLNHLVYQNKSDMTHFLLFNKVPDSISIREYSQQLTKPFQEVMDAISNNQEPPNNFPAWLGDMVNMGGVGLTSAGQTSESYVNFTPGNYIVECYIKSDGIFHSSSGMLKQIRVVDQVNEASEPTANITVNVDSSGLTLQGELVPQAGNVCFKISHGVSKLFPNFTRPDVHLVKITEGASLEALEEYMDWTTVNGMVSNAPVVFLGGVQEMPEGSTSYFRQYLSPGKYILIGEVPTPRSNGFYYEFEIGS